MLRIYDLIAADPEPSTPEEWDRIVASLRVATGAASELQQEAREPKPRMVDGVGLCSVHCPHYFRDDYTEGCKHGGNGAVAQLTRSMVPCRPWVDATMQHHRDVNESQAAAWKREVDGLRCEFAEERAKNESLHARMDSAGANQGWAPAMPCGHIPAHSRMTCGDMTVARDASGNPRCRPHGGRSPGEVR
jgi:hypothetical protein